MKKTSLLCFSVVIVTIILVFQSCSSYSFPKPKKVSSQPSALEQKLIMEGTELHDRGKFREAVEKYSQVLKTNPDCALAMYEMAYSYFPLGILDSAEKYSMMALNYKDITYPMSCDLAGSILDVKGNPKKAIEVYSMGIEANPNYQMLYFNRGVTNIGLKELRAARLDFQRSIKLNPTHASTHYYLSLVYLNSYDEIPSSLAGLTYILLDSASSRSLYMKEIAETILGINNKKRVTNRNGEIQIPMEMLFDELGFISMAISIRLSVIEKDSTKKFKGLSVSSTKEALDLVLGIIKPGKEMKSFAGNYYLDFYSRLYSEGFTEYLANMLFYMNQPEEWKKYKETNKETVQKFKIWLDTYPWNTDVQIDPLEKNKKKK